MNDFDLYDFFGKHGYRARALTRPQRGAEYLNANAAWFTGMDAKPSIVLKGLWHQFALDGTEALESSALWEVPETKLAGGINALRVLGAPTQVMQDAKMRLFVV